MQNKRRVHGKKIEKFRTEQAENEEEHEIIERNSDEEYDSDGEQAPKRRKKAKIIKPSENRDKDYFIPYQQTDRVTEEGFAINSFTRDAKQAEFSVTADSVEGQRLNKTLQRWDRKKKKMVNVTDPRAGKIRTEHGLWISASYKTDRYAKWKERTKLDERLEQQQADSDDDNAVLKPQIRHNIHTHWGRHNAKVERKKMIDPELKNKDQLMKQRLRKEKLQARELSSKMRNDAKRKRSAAKRAAKNKKK
jgi:ATP-dependent RNA helicase DDX54/DBP10